MTEHPAAPQKLDNTSVRFPPDLLREFDAMCKSPEVDTDRSKELRRLMRERIAEYKASLGRAA